MSRPPSWRRFGPSCRRAPTWGWLICFTRARFAASRPAARRQSRPASRSPGRCVRRCRSARTARRCGCSNRESRSWCRVAMPNRSPARTVSITSRSSRRAGRSRCSTCRCRREGTTLGVLTLVSMDENRAFAGADLLFAIGPRLARSPPPSTTPAFIARRRTRCAGARTFSPSSPTISGRSCSGLGWESTRCCGRSSRSSGVAGGRSSIASSA